MKLKIISAIVVALALYGGLKYVEYLRTSNSALKKELASKDMEIKALNLAVDEINKEYQRLNEIMGSREMKSNTLKFNIDSIKKGVRDEKDGCIIDFNLFDELNSRL